ncbi:aminoacyl-histidine dipeptidase (peptidase D) [Vibrio nigripulchritudo SFn27]|uniref:Cytosol non-specific dipeptidase n=1 Tax=Vibrio nigripulchritudo TaxID=28173 RepID=U4K2Q9_9VIBR|nr:aminoacyl-histidine dipeptidase [Vibrio nigripulchritudo]CCN35393.1 aminoacyl-histidine dipeptidase (peptidase D) [Vibrio nigripulchritudo AM115]CCN39433.1 aminoacyl-histidine dipeptidase (peptidase D) [Vibrio nigripulchritudo FTn2]CCN63470.1 aminoacyl-histidine dipeptidase (peptidase D) [Vibrio nigripulchritudo POn4]CCN78113.1 aminoacyl-histidine dipeptidase (peptidase D) [Vibrio nigripulchritudo SO65]CCN81864.1 aminoacyl-histidine dipeptidase (peptidase D) [Vibrio nigripulchritudo BLFn1]
MSEFHSEISQLQPAKLWQFFDKICSIPHPSKHEEELAQYIVNWATEQGFDVKRDPTGNVFIKKPATPGMENKKGVVLQAHIDMVPQKNEDTDHDFTKDPIQPYIDGEWVTAKGTTLGSDNGIGMASCLAVLASDDIKHGPLEVLLTIDEEAGMTGAFGLEKGWLEGDILLNTDSEQEGEVYMGCAGGIDGSITFDITREALPEGYVTRLLTLKGLKGGHSGCDIHTGRGNANKLFARFLAGHAQELDLRLIDFRGGSLRNAIPREAWVTVAVPAANQDKLADLLSTYTELLSAELGRIETDIVSFNEESDTTSGVFSQADQSRFIAALNAAPNGVIRMSDDIEGVVETSLNVGVITTEADKVTVLCLIRSLIDSGRQQVESTLRSIAELAGAQIDFSGAYPGWKPDADSEIMAIFRDMYEGIYGHKPNIMVIHAGLECGLFKEPYPEMDMVSFGPTIKFPHSPDEKVKIDTVALYWEQMVALLEAIPEKK